jgi:formamidopyrimidine-DNA glycosylase
VYPDDGIKKVLSGDEYLALCPECLADYEEDRERANDEQYAMYEEQVYWAAAHNAWLKADKKCRVCDTPLTLDEFEQRRCPKCSIEEIPF